MTKKSEAQELMATTTDFKGQTISHPVSVRLKDGKLTARSADALTAGYGITVQAHPNKDTMNDLMVRAIKGFVESNNQGSVIVSKNNVVLTLAVSKVRKPASGVTGILKTVKKWIRKSNAN